MTARITPLTMTAEDEEWCRVEATKAMSREKMLVTELDATRAALFAAITERDEDAVAYHDKGFVQTMAIIEGLVPDAVRSVLMAERDAAVARAERAEAALAFRRPAVVQEDAEHLLDPETPIEEIDAELRAAGLDPEKVGRVGSWIGRYMKEHERADRAEAALAKLKERRAPVQMERGVIFPARIPWHISERAWGQYAAYGHGDQSHEMLCSRGGFGVYELVHLLNGRNPYRLSASAPTPAEIAAVRDECEGLKGGG